MRRVGAVLAALVLTAGCGDGEEQAVGDGDAIEGRTFLSQRVVEDGADRPLVAGTTIRIEFADGEVRAHAGCNHLFGTVESLDGGVLVVGPMGGTEMGCDAERHAQDQWLVDLLTSAPTVALDGDILMVRGASVELTLLDRRVADPDRPLEGTRWVVDTILSDDMAMSIPSDAAATLHLVDGRVEGFTGCNEITGSYRLVDGVLHLDGLVQTDRACDPDTMSLEEAVVAVTAQTLDYSIVAGRLTLVAPDGRGLGLHAAPGA